MTTPAEAHVEAMQRNVRLLAEQAVLVKRASFPLKLWPDDPEDPPSSGWFQVIEGELHYLPLPENRAEMARSCGVPVVDGDDLAVELLGRPPRPKDDLWSDIFWRKYKYACGVYHESARNHDPARNLLPLHT